MIKASEVKNIVKWWWDQPSGEDVFGVDCGICGLNVTSLLADNWSEITASWYEALPSYLAVLAVSKVPSKYIAFLMF